MSLSSQENDMCEIRQSKQIQMMYVPHRMILKQMAKITKQKHVTKINPELLSKHMHIFVSCHKHTLSFKAISIQL